MIQDLLSYHNLALALIYIERHIKQNKANKMKNSQYPRIKKSSCSVVLFTSEKSGFLLENLRCEAFHPTYDLYSYRTDWIEGQFEDYPEWLKNKCGTIKSKNQRNFIIAVAKNHRIRTGVFSHGEGSKFFFFKNLGNLNMRIVSNSVSERGYEAFNLEFLSNIGFSNNLNESGMDKVNAEVEEQLIEALKDDEWPKVGDRVLYGHIELNFKVIAIDCGLAWIKHDSGKSELAEITDLKKPPSPEVELCEALAKKGVQDVVILAHQIVNGDFDCLKYIPKEER